MLWLRSRGWSVGWSQGVLGGVGVCWLGFLVIGVFVTWSGQAVLPGGFVVVKRQQHDVHGKNKHPRQKQVEDQVEEQDQPLWGETGGVFLLYSTLHLLLLYTSPSSPLNVISIILVVSPAPCWWPTFIWMAEWGEEVGEVEEGVISQCVSALCLSSYWLF